MGETEEGYKQTILDKWIEIQVIINDKAFVSHSPSCPVLVDFSLRLKFIICPSVNS